MRALIPHEPGFGVFSKLRCVSFVVYLNHYTDQVAFGKSKATGFTISSHTASSKHLARFHNSCRILDFNTEVHKRCRNEEAGDAPK